MLNLVYYYVMELDIVYFYITAQESDFKIHIIRVSLHLFVILRVDPILLHLERNTSEPNTHHGTCSRRDPRGYPRGKRKKAHYQQLGEMKTNRNRRQNGKKWLKIC